MMKTIYLAVDGIAEGAHEIDAEKDLLSEVQRKIPQAKSAQALDNDQVVFIVKTRDD
jgi:hypothetical protein